MGDVPNGGRQGENNSYTVPNDCGPFEPWSDENEWLNAFSGVNVFIRARRPCGERVFRQ